MAMEILVTTNRYQVSYDKLYGTGTVIRRADGQTSLNITGVEMDVLKDIILKLRSGRLYNLYSIEVYENVINNILDEAVSF